METLRFLEELQRRGRALHRRRVRPDARRARGAGAGALRHPRDLAARRRSARHRAVLRGGARRPSAAPTAASSTRRSIVCRRAGGCGAIRGPARCRRRTPSSTTSGSDRACSASGARLRRAQPFGARSGEAQARFDLARGRAQRRRRAGDLARAGARAAPRLARGVSARWPRRCRRCRRSRAAIASSRASRRCPRARRRAAGVRPTLRTPPDSEAAAPRDAVLKGRRTL